MIVFGACPARLERAFPGVLNCIPVVGAHNLLHPLPPGLEILVVKTGDRDAGLEPLRGQGRLGSSVDEFANSLLRWSSCRGSPNGTHTFWRL